MTKPSHIHIAVVALVTDDHHHSPWVPLAETSSKAISLRRNHHKSATIAGPGQPGPSFPWSDEGNATRTASTTPSARRRHLQMALSLTQTTSGLNFGRQPRFTAHGCLVWPAEPPPTSSTMPEKAHAPGTSRKNAGSTNPDREQCHPTPRCEDNHRSHRWEGRHPAGTQAWRRLTDNKDDLI